jgi:hypothetical protein
VLNADFVVNMDYLTSDLAYRSKVVYLLKRFDIADISFDNANIQKYRTFLLRKEVMGEIEQEIQDLFSQYIGRKSQKRIFSKISRAERDFFAIPKTIHIKFKRYRLEDLPERDSYPFDESVKALVEKLIRRSKLAEILEIDLQRAASKLVREQQEMNESIRKMDRMRDHQISKFRDIHLMKELEEIEKISKELVRQSELLDQQKKEFKLERPVEGRGKKPDVKVGQRYKEMQDELEKTAIWIERRIRGLKKRKSLLTKKSELIQKIKKIAGR